MVWPSSALKRWRLAQIGPRGMARSLAPLRGARGTSTAAELALRFLMSLEGECIAVHHTVTLDPELQDLQTAGSDDPPGRVVAALPGGE